MKGELGKLMQQAQKMQERMQEAQEEMARMEVEGAAGGGMVRVTMNGRHEVRRVQIDDSLMGDDRDMLEDLVAAATNDAVQKVEAAQKEHYSDMAAGMNLPAGFKMPF
ncbi:MAG: YbaB/EbfC family nucleoid-associated protein [Halofilum sp. (in: g-proteobacteria)]|nr:YbaB/EbfC family nucleoid-associated protein [Halofilum sp. (in: g-proteobacteria)]